MVLDSFSGFSRVYVFKLVTVIFFFYQNKEGEKMFNVQVILTMNRTLKTYEYDRRKEKASKLVLRRYGSSLFLTNRIEYNVNVYIVFGIFIF